MEKDQIYEDLNKLQLYNMEQTVKEYEYVFDRNIKMAKEDEGKLERVKSE